MKSWKFQKLESCANNHKFCWVWNLQKSSVTLLKVSNFFETFNLWRSLLVPLRGFYLVILKWVYGCSTLHIMMKKTFHEILVITGLKSNMEKYVQKLSDNFLLSQLLRCFWWRRKFFGGGSFVRFSWPHKKCDRI